MGFNTATFTTSIEDGSLEIREDTDGARVAYLRLRLPAGYRNQDVVVRPLDTRLVVMTTGEEIIRDVHMPDSVDPFTVQASFSEDGTLHVEAPLPC